MAMFVPGVGYTDLLPQYAAQNPNQAAVGQLLGSAPATPSLQSPQSPGFAQNLLSALPALAQALTARTSDQLSSVASNFALAEQRRRELERQRVDENNRFERARADQKNERREDLMIRAQDQDQALKIRKEDKEQAAKERQQDINRDLFKFGQTLKLQQDELDARIENNQNELAIAQQNANTSSGQLRIRQLEFNLAKDEAERQKLKGYAQGLVPITPLSSMSPNEQKTAIENQMRLNQVDPSIAEGPAYTQAYKKARDQLLVQEKEAQKNQAATIRSYLLELGGGERVELPDAAGDTPPPNPLTDIDLRTDAQLQEAERQQIKQQTAQKIVEDPGLLLSKSEGADIFPEAKNIKKGLNSNSRLKQLEALSLVAKPLVEGGATPDDIKSVVTTYAEKAGITLSVLEEAQIMAMAQPQDPFSQMVGPAGGIPGSNPGDFFGNLFGSN